MIKHVPNILTVSRIIVIPIIVASFYLGQDNPFSYKLAAFLFLTASITDFFDGYLARTLSVESKLGTFLDPIADKLLIASIILMLLNFNRIDVLPALAIICREILVSGLREFLAGLSVSVPVSKLAKVKTAVQMIALFILLLGSKGSSLPYVDFIGRVMIWVAAGLTIFTGYAYLRSALKYIAEE